MKKIIFCFVALLSLASFSHAQTIKTVKGNVCSHEYSQNMTGGQIRLSVGGEIIELWHTFSGTPGDRPRKTTKYAPDPTGNHYFSRIGTELIVKYKESSPGDLWAVSITSTGKRKKSRSCSTE